MRRHLSILLFFLAFNLTAFAKEPLKILHITFHQGCLEEFEGVAKALSLDLTNWMVQNLPPKFLDGATQTNALYNIGHERAKKIWDLHRDFFESFDVIITSDTAPLSRIFLQNGWKKPLIIWICNRFDYADGATLDCSFPDQEYYDLFREATRLDNVKIIAYTQFEHFYAKSKGIDTGSLTITPCGLFIQERIGSSIPSHIVREDTFFLPPYHNETIFMNFSQHCTNLGINNYCGRYNGPTDLQNFKGIIHIPYSWSNLAFFENIHLGIPYFIPSLEFMKNLISMPQFYLPDSSFFNAACHLSEWYSSEHAEVFTYFDSWTDLQKKLKEADFPTLREKIKLYGKQYGDKMLGRWEEVFESIDSSTSKNPVAF